MSYWKRRMSTMPGRCSGATATIVWSSTTVAAAETSPKTTLYGHPPKLPVVLMLTIVPPRGRAEGRGDREQRFLGGQRKGGQQHQGGQKDRTTHLALA